MLRLLSDENFDNLLVRRLLRHFANLDLVRVQDVGLRQQDDETILEWAANEQRILLTHDLNTIPGFAYNRIKRNLPMPGIFAVPHEAASGEIFDSLLLIITYSDATEWENQVVFLPLK
jgi:hypothetical protein